MIVYFADRNMDILGQASTHLPEGIRITDDLKTEDIDTGVAVFECDIHFDRGTRSKVEEWAEVGNYILRSTENENEFYTIIDCKIDTKKQTVYIYAEDDGLDLINDVAGAYEADQPYPIEDYILRFAGGAGWEIGINEVEGLTKKLSWNSSQTASARLLSIAEGFDNCELSFSFKIKGLQVVKKYINIYEERGEDTGVQLRLNKEIDSITTNKTVNNLATALKPTGGTPDDAEDPITLLGYEYDDGNFYVDGDVLKSRKALENWSRFLWKNDETGQEGGHITREFSSDTTSQAVLCEQTIAELKKICDKEVNYEIDISKFPENVKIGDRVNIIDDEGELYLSSRVLVLESSEVENTKTATLGEHLIRKSSISSKVTKLAAQFAKQTVSVKRATQISNNAKKVADNAVKQAETAATKAENALSTANKASASSETAVQSAANAQAQAQAAQAAVEKVEESVASIEKTITDAQNAANNAHQAANTATQKAEEAKTAAENAVKNSSEAKAAAENAQNSSASAIAKAEEAIGTADTAKNTAETASTTAQAAKLDAEQAEKDVASFGENLETFKQTVLADYTRKTELTETKASLQAQITANANQLTITHNKVVEVDETANNAADLAAQAQSEAAAAQSQADQATADASKAQKAADDAAAAAQSAQTEADTAKAAAATAQGVADKAKTDLEAAQADLATVQGRVDATEEEIVAAQQAVTAAQQAADKAQEDADTAAQNAANAQNTANTAVTNAANAQTKANEAVNAASLAQQTADEAKGNAATAQAKANEAAQAAATAQETANTAKNNAAAAQSKADQAASEAAAAQKAADDAETKAQQAATDLATAQQNLEDVTSRVGATEAEVEAAQAAVVTAQAAADKAKQDAAAAQSTADTARANAATAQTAANNAKTAADNAQATADEAQDAADKAQADVNALEVRVTTAETSITKNAEEIALKASKTEVTETLGGYYNKKETDAAISTKANEINLSVKEQVENIDIGGRNLVPVSKIETGRNVETTQEFELRDAWATVFVSGENLSNILAPDTEYIVRYELELIEKTTVPTAFDMRAGFLIYREGVWIDIGTYAFSESTEVGAKATVQHTFTTPKTWNGEQLICYSRRWTTEGSDPIGFDAFKVTNFKIEKGNKATDWTPAPEDVSEEIGAVDAVAADVDGRLKKAEAELSVLSNQISMLVRDENGASQMTQDSESATWSFNTEKIDNTMSSHSKDIDDLKNAAGDTDTNVKNLQDKLGSWEEHISIGTYEDEPCLKLFEEDSPYVQYVTNTRRIVVELVETTNSETGETETVEVVLSITNLDTASHNKVIAKETAQIGGFAWKKRGANRICLMWEGDVE